MPNKRNKKKIIKSTNIVLLIFISLLIVTLLIFLSIQFEIFSKLIQKDEPVVTFTIQDSCAFIAGQLVHNIQDEGGCQNQCITACEVREKEYLDSRFTRSFDACNNCYCECK